MSCSVPLWVPVGIAFAVQTITLVIFACVYFASDGADHSDAVWATSNVPLAVPILDFVHAAQLERGLTMVLLTSSGGNASRAPAAVNLLAQRATTSAACESMQAQLSRLDAAILNASVMQDAMSTLGSMDAVRREVDSDTITALQGLTYFHTLVGQFLDVVSVIVQMCPVTSVAGPLGALVPLVRVKEEYGELYASGTVLVQRQGNATVSDITYAVSRIQILAEWERIFRSTWPGQPITTVYESTLLPSSSVQAMRSMAATFETYDASTFLKNTTAWVTSSADALIELHAAELGAVSAVVSSVDTATVTLEVAVAGLVLACFVSFVLLGYVGYVSLGRNRAHRTAEAFRRSEAEAAQAIADMDLEAVWYLKTLSSPTSVQRSLARIAAALEQYRAFLPASLWSGNKDEDDSNDAELPPRASEVAVVEDSTDGGSTRGSSSHCSSRGTSRNSSDSRGIRLTSYIERRRCTLLHVHVANTHLRMPAVYEDRGERGVLSDMEERVRFVEVTGKKERGVLLRFTEDSIVLGFNVSGRDGSHNHAGCRAALTVFAGLNSDVSVSTTVVVHSGSALCGLVGSTTTRSVVCFTRDQLLVPRLHALCAEHRMVVSTPGVLALRGYFALRTLVALDEEGGWALCPEAQRCAYGIEREVHAGTDEWMYQVDLG